MSENSDSHRLISAREYALLFGVLPEGVDIERANCPLAGNVGHMMCGICEKCAKPRFMCGHGSIV